PQHSLVIAAAQPAPDRPAKCFDDWLALGRDSRPGRLCWGFWRRGHGRLPGLQGWASFCTASGDRAPE
ncbi:MAG: hypothetical protein ACK55I_34130, partial [bacterium]